MIAFLQQSVKQIRQYKIQILSLLGLILMLQVGWAKEKELPKPNSNFVTATAQCLRGNFFTFNSNSTISAGSINSYIWDFGDGNTGTGPSISHSYANPGDYRVILTVTSDMGCTDTVSHVFTVFPQPIANFTAPAAQCLTNNSYNLVSASTIGSGNINEYSWDLGDGTTASGQTITHSFAADGNYHVKLIVVSDNGCADTVSHDINVYPKPKAIFSDPVAQCFYGNKFNFTGQPNQNNQYTYHWRFGDGSTASGPNAQHSYASAGIYDVSFILQSANGCSDSMARSVVVIPQPKASFSDPPPQCLLNNHFFFSSFNDTNHIKIRSQTWDFGDGISSPDANSTHSYQHSGQFPVSLKVISDEGCTDSASAIITVLAQPHADFITPAAQWLPGNLFVFNSSSTLLSGSIQQANWTFGDGSYANGFDTQHHYTSAGSFNVILSVQTEQGCTDSIMHPIIVNAQTITAIFDAPSAQCLPGNRFSFSSLSKISAGSITQHEWSFGDGEKASGINVMHSFATAGTYIVKLVTTADSGLKDSITQHVIVHPQPDASIVSSSIEQCLSGNHFKFTGSLGLNSVPVKTFTWHLGDSLIVTAITVNKSYESPGEYQVKLIARSNVGCADTSAKMITVYQEPTLHINAPASAICISDSTVLWSEAQAGSGTISHYQWYQNGIEIHGATAPTLTVKNAGNYALQVMNSNGCKQTSEGTVIQMLPLPEAILTTLNPGSICEGDSTLLKAAGGDKYAWYLNNQLITGANRATMTAKSEGIYKVKALNALGCGKMAADSALLQMIKKPLANFINSTACVNTPVFFQNNSTTLYSGLVNWSWNFGNGNSSIQSNPAQAFAQKGTYMVSLQVSPRNCPNLVAQITKPITVYAADTGIRYPAVRTIINSKTILQARTIGNTYQWFPSTGLNNARIASPTLQTSNQVDFLIKITNQAGCITYDSLLVTVFSQVDILVPKAFTPNADGHNDRLDLFTIGIRELRYFRVFNRWGQLMFETKNPDQKWDGRYQGIPQPSETYVWIAEGVGIDDTIVTKRGQTILLR